MKYQLATAAAAGLFLALALASGEHRRGALVGATISGLTAVGVMLAMAYAARGKKPTQGAVAVMAAAFLLRLVLVGIGTVVVARAGASVIGFVVAFFVPYFFFSALEGAYVHSLRRGTGPTA